jgi:hypothetical protein
VQTFPLRAYPLQRCSQSPAGQHVSQQQSVRRQRSLQCKFSLPPRASEHPAPACMIAFNYGECLDCDAVCRKIRDWLATDVRLQTLPWFSPHRRTGGLQRQRLGPLPANGCVGHLGLAVARKNSAASALGQEQDPRHNRDPGDSVNPMHREKGGENCQFIGSKS